MGTHPIFESDFDCLTDCKEIWATKTFGSRTKVKTPPVKVTDTAGSLDIVLSVRLKNTDSTCHDRHSEKTQPSSDSKNSTKSVAPFHWNQLTSSFKPDYDSFDCLTKNCNKLILQY